MASRVVRTLAFVAALTLSSALTAAADDVKDAWAALAKGGHVALIRHGNAPPGYGGDPPGFKLDDCATQRNLDELGRQQARVLGEAFRANGVRVDRILTSPICRCVDTAELMAVGAVEKSRALLPDIGSRRVLAAELEELVASWRGPGTLVLVTHGIAIGRLTGTTLDQAETLVLRPMAEKAPAGRLPRGGSIVGRIPALR